MIYPITQFFYYYIDMQVLPLVLALIWSCSLVTPLFIKQDYFREVLIFIIFIIHLLVIVFLCFLTFSPFIFILIMGLYSLVTPFLIRKDLFKEVLMFLISILHLINAVLLYFLYKGGYKDYITLFQLGVFDFTLNFTLLGNSIFLLIAILWPIAIMYTIGFLKVDEEANTEDNCNKFLFFTNLCVVISNLIVLSSNFFTMLICYEILTFATIPLIKYTISSRTDKALYKYMQGLFLPSLLFLMPVLVILQYKYGTTDFLEIVNLQHQDQFLSPFESIILVLFILCGTAKAATVPFHMWLPTAMIAPYPVSAILHAVAVVNVGVFCLLTGIFSVLGEQQWLLYYIQCFIVCGVLYTAFKALFQTSIKKILAYSTISNLGIVVLSAFIGTTGSITAAITHMFTHSIGKITLFYAAGCLYVVAKRTDIKDLYSIGYYIPVMSLCFTIGSLSLIGFPPLAGFVSKYNIILEAIKEHNHLVIFVTILTSIVSCCYLSRIIKIMYTKRDNIDINFELVLPKYMFYATVLCTGLIILFPFNSILVNFIYNY